MQVSTVISLFIHYTLYLLIISKADFVCLWFYVFQSLDEYVAALLTLKQKIFDTEWVKNIYDVIIIIWHPFKMFTSLAGQQHSSCMVAK